jgi:hypothetical protein
LGLAGFQDRVGSQFFTLALFAFANLSVLDLFVTERALFVREREAVSSCSYNSYCLCVFVFISFDNRVDILLLRIMLRKHWLICL